MSNNHTTQNLKNKHKNALIVEINKNFTYQIADYALPAPNHIGEPNNIGNCLVVWLIDGDLYSTNARRFYLDIQKRLKKSIESLKIRTDKLKELDYLQDKIIYSHHRETSLKDFSSLKSIGYDKIKIDPTLFFEKKNKNSFFNYARKVANRILIDKKCKKQVAEFSITELFEATREGHYLAKEKKAVHYIIKNIYKWYQEKDFTTRPESLRSRADNARALNKKRTDQTFKLIFNTIKETKITNISKLAEVVNLSRLTIYRYFKSFFSFFRELFFELKLTCSFFKESLESFVEVVFGCCNVVKPLKSTGCNTILREEKESKKMTMKERIEAKKIAENQKREEKIKKAMSDVRKMIEEMRG